MAKDGTNRGGPRIGAGRPRKISISGNINNDMQTTQNNQPALEHVVPQEVLTNTTPNDIPEELPEVEDYMKAPQKNGKPLDADKILYKLYKWLDLMGCKHMINPMLLDQYAMDRARWIQLQNAISEYGFITRKNSTGNITSSPFYIELNMTEKQMNNTLFLIDQIVRDNVQDKYIPYTEAEKQFESYLTK